MMKFVFDENVPPKIAYALKALGKDACPYFEHWPKGARDLEWIPHASAKGWCIVTSDRLRHPYERAALRQHNARIILLTTRNLQIWDQVRLVINRWEQIEATAAKEKPPFIFRFTPRSTKGQRIDF